MTTTLSIQNEERDHKGALVIAAVAIAVALAAALSIWAITSSRSTNPAASPAPASHTPAPAHAPASAQTPIPAHTVTPATTVAPAKPAIRPAPAVPAAPSSAGVPTGAVAAITSWENANGGVGTWQLSSAQSSTTNPAYVLFHLAAAPGHEATFQPGYGFALNTNGVWDVAAYGNNDVGCPAPGTTSPSISAAVLSGFGLACPSA